MTHQDPPEWIRESIERVTAQYRPSNQPCSLEAWPGAPCELRLGHRLPCKAPSRFNLLKGSREPLFDGQIPSHTNPLKRYRVVVNQDWTATCACEGYMYRHQDCSHISLVKSVLNEDKDVLKDNAP